MNYYPRHLGDYARDTGHLTLAEHGAYTLLLDRYYATERPIGREEAFRICHASSKLDKAAVSKVLSEFFLWTDAGYRSKRADEEIAKAAEKGEKARQSAQSRWMRTHSERNANAMRTHSERNANGMLSNNQEPITNNQSALAYYPDQPKAEVGQDCTPRITRGSLLGVVGSAKKGER